MFNVVDVSTDAVIESFASGADAAEYARAWNDDARRNGLDARVRVMRVATDDDGAWKLREQARLDKGTYAPAPWCHESWAILDHYAHISQDDESKVAFTRDS